MSEADKQLLESVWSRVFKDSGRVLAQHMKLGYSGVKELANPTIQEMLETLRELQFLIIAVMKSSELDYDEHRLMLNAQRQIANMELLEAALAEGNEADYESALAALKTQVAF